MPSKIAVTHAPEGAGNAIRMLAVAKELRERGHEVKMAGGGPGKMFVEMNGFEEFEPEDINFIEEREKGSTIRGMAETVPAFLKRFIDFYKWIKKEQPDILVTDDPLAMIAARVQGIRFVRIEHATSDMIEKNLEKNAHRIANYLSIKMGEEFYHTCLWPDEEPEADLKRVNPLVVEPSEEEETGSFDVLVVPGTYSEGFDEIIEELKEEGLNVKVVGGDSWEAVPAMLPFMDEADAVLCTGFSSISESVVAGTKCVVYPFIDAQKGVAREIEERNIEGIDIVRSNRDAVEALTEDLESPDFQNGATEVADDIEEILGENQE